MRSWLLTCSVCTSTKCALPYRVCLTESRAPFVARNPTALSLSEASRLRRSSILTRSEMAWSLPATRLPRGRHIAPPDRLSALRIGEPRWADGVMMIAASDCQRIRIEVFDLTEVVVAAGAPCGTNPRRTKWWERGRGGSGQANGWEWRALPPK